MSLAPEPTSANEADRSRGARFREGVTAMLPFLPSVIPIALAGGALGPTSGLSPWATLGLAMAANSATAQFVVFSLVLQHAGLVAIFLTTLILGLRMIVYAMILREYLDDIPRWWKPIIAFGLIDVMFFVVIDRFRAGSLSNNKGWFFLGASTLMYGSWTILTAVGAFLSSLVPNLESLGLEFPMIALFVAMLVLSVTNRKLFLIALTAGVIALLAHPLPFNLGILVAMIAGIAVGAAWDELARRRPVSISAVAPDMPDPSGRTIVENPLEEGTS